MFKKILISVSFFLYFIASAHAAPYVSTLSNDDTHKVYETGIIETVNNYLDDNGGTVNDIDELTVAVIDSITNNGGWGIDITEDNWQYDKIVTITGNKLTVGCGNTDFGYFTLDSGSTSTSNPVATPTAYTPAPVTTVTSNTSYGGACSSYISGYSEYWSDCSINPDWSTGGLGSCEQVNTWSPVTSSCGTTVTTADTSCVSTGSGAEVCSTSYSSYCDSSSCPGSASKPADTYATKTVEMAINNSIGSDCNSKYANNSDTCKFNVLISGISINQSKSVTGLTAFTLNGFEDNTKEPSDRISGVYDFATNNALNFGNVVSSTIGGYGNSHYFEVSGIQAYSSFKNDNGSIKFNIVSTSGNSSPVTLNGIDYDFKKPYYGALEVVGEDLKIGTEQTLKLNVTNGNCSLCSSIYNISNYSGSLDVDDQVNYVVQDKNNETSLDNNPEINFTINYIGDSVIDKTKLVISSYIDYTLDGKNVKYILGEGSESDDNTIYSNDALFIGAKIVGNTELSGKYVTTGQNDNISNLDRLELIQKIKKDTYNYISSMNSGDVVNGVKYVEGDIEISGDLTYETLVVKDGNVIIKGDLNTAENKLGIIVLKDSYNIANDYNNKGNIYVKPNVEYINAIVYTDGAFISSDSTGTPYIVDTTERTSTLSKQLIMKGSLISKNTIGGAIASGGNYILPGGISTSDFDLAMIFDLNYIRRGNGGCEDSVAPIGTCDNYDDGFIIIYNPSVQMDPPKLF